MDNFESETTSMILNEYPRSDKILLVLAFSNQNLRFIKENTPGNEIINKRQILEMMEKRIVILDKKTGSKKYKLDLFNKSVIFGANKVIAGSKKSEEFWKLYDYDLNGGIHIQEYPIDTREHIMS
jgi:hypothetical protein